MRLISHKVFFIQKVFVYLYRCPTVFLHDRLVHGQYVKVLLKIFLFQIFVGFICIFLQKKSILVVLDFHKILIYTHISCKKDPLKPAYDNTVKEMLKKC